MVVGEDAGDGDNGGEHNPEVEVVIWRLLKVGGLNCVGHKAEDGTHPQEHGEPGEEVLAELDPLRGGGRRGERVGPILL